MLFQWFAGGNEWGPVNEYLDLRPRTIESAMLTTFLWPSSGVFGNPWSAIWDRLLKPINFPPFLSASNDEESFVAWDSEVKDLIVQGTCCTHAAQRKAAFNTTSRVAIFTQLSSLFFTGPSTPRMHLPSMQSLSRREHQATGMSPGPSQVDVGRI